MKILVVGSGAREHAIAWKCVQSELTTRVYCAPGNGGTGGLARNIPVQADDVAGLVRFAKKERIGLAILGNDASVAAGAGDALRDAGFPVFGPSRGPGRIESSKAFAKELMGRAAIPTAGYGVFTEAGPALDFARRHRGRVAVKADGLALGKGVVVCGSLEEAGGAIEAMLVKKTFGRAGSTVVVEERLDEQLLVAREARFDEHDVHGHLDTVRRRYSSSYSLPCTSHEKFWAMPFAVSARHAAGCGLSARPAVRSPATLRSPPDGSVPKPAVAELDSATVIESD